jgi:curved DNA-binding protein CbpA
MGIWDRLSAVINSYINDFGEQTSSRFRTYGIPRSGDPDLDSAYSELNDFLNGKEPRRSEKARAENAGQYSWRDSEKKAGGSYESGGARASANRGFSGDSGGAKLPPEELRADFEILGVPFSADGETCKAAYKKLLKIHHPDHHAGHEGNFKKATERSAKINAAYDRIEKWRESGNRT